LQVVELLKEKWFHGDISSAEAEKLLKAEPKGTYLVRFSTRYASGSVFTLKSNVSHTCL
jgi:hypothetical protein